jgi:UDP-glucose 4-epimerase
MDHRSLSGKRVLVTGGAGFIGSHIVEVLLEAGAEPVVLDDLSSGSRANVPAGVELLVVDVADPAVEAVVKDARPDIVIHAAAQVSVPVSVADPGRDRAVNLAGTEHVLRGALACGAHRFVFVSSGGAIYGEAAGADETWLPRPASPYGIHKLAAEGYVATSGLSFGIARYANVYGPRQRSDLEGGVVAILCERPAAGLPITISGTGAQSRDFVYVRDIAEAMVLIATTERDGTWNVSTGQGTSVNALRDELSALTDGPVGVSHAPARPGDVVVSRLSSELIGAELGWQPRYALRPGLIETLQPHESNPGVQG